MTAIRLSINNAVNISKINEQLKILKRKSYMLNLLLHWITLLDSMNRIQKRERAE